jgi:hypothetical protein
LAVVAAATVAVIAAACVGLRRARIYLSLAMFHGYLERTMLTGGHGA